MNCTVISPLRARMIEDMSVRGFNEHTRRDYVRHVRAFAAFIGRSPDTAMGEELRLFQLHQTQSGMQPPSINSAVSALRFFFAVTLAAAGGIGAEVQGGIRHGLRRRAARLGSCRAQGRRHLPAARRIGLNLVADENQRTGDPRGVSRAD
jgi:hypothetical protein